MLKVFTKRKRVNRHLKMCHQEKYANFSIARPISNYTTIELFKVVAPDLNGISPTRQETIPISDSVMELLTPETCQSEEKEITESITLQNMESPARYSDSSTIRASIIFPPNEEKIDLDISDSSQLSSESSIGISGSTSPETHQINTWENFMEISNSESYSSTTNSTSSFSVSLSSSDIKTRLRTRSRSSKLTPDSLSDSWKKKKKAISSDSESLPLPLSSPDFRSSTEESSRLDNSCLDIVIYSPLSSSYVTFDRSFLPQSPIRLIYFIYRWFINFVTISCSIYFGNHWI